MQNRRGNTQKSKELQFAKSIRTAQELSAEDGANPIRASQRRKRAIHSPGALEEHIAKVVNSIELSHQSGATPTATTTQVAKMANKQEHSPPDSTRKRARPTPTMETDNSNMSWIPADGGPPVSVPDTDKTQFPSTATTSSTGSMHVQCSSSDSAHSVHSLFGADMLDGCMSAMGPSAAFPAGGDASGVAGTAAVGRPSGNLSWPRAQQMM